MDAYVIGFLVGVLMAGLSAVAIWTILGLAVSVIRRVKKKDTWLMIVVYAVETIVTLSVVIVLAGLASRISFDTTAFWLGVSLTILGNGFIFVPALGKKWNMLTSELTRREGQRESKH
jgi:hypothetical protein